jgi:putative OPT family oligopeptide transporter
MSNNNNLNQDSDSPIIPASQNPPEITFRVIVIGIFLTIILAAANAFLGLKVGQTISASIPAAIISMSILRFFRNSNVLENTMVQTMASVGESLIAGITFILPALIILHVWDGFYYWQTVTVGLLGGILGVLFTIPLRRALLVDKTLRYPEGFAITNVLKASANKDKADVKSLIWGGVVGSTISLFQSGFQILTDTFQYWVKTSNTVYGFGLGLSPALIAAGYIVGINVSISLLVGIVIGWIAGVPALTYVFGLPNVESANDIAMTIWKSHVKIMGVGTMLVGGLWTICTLIKPIGQGLSTSFQSIRDAKNPNALQAIRTERDIPMNYVFWAALLILIPIFILLTQSIIPDNSLVSHNFKNALAAFCAIYILIGGFVFCSVSAYFAGLIGSTNTPVSGLLVSTLLILCLILLGFFTLNGGIVGKEMLGVVLAIGCGVILASAISISNDTMQDLKVGQMVGATPWKQQLMLVVGVVVSAVVVPPILELLYNAYGIGGVFPHPGMSKEHMLAAPQAGLMATVAQGVYERNLEWSMIITGAVIAVICIIVDTILKRTNGARLPVLAVGVGIYLPLDSSVPVVLGGVLAYIVQGRLNKLYPRPAHESEMAKHRHRGLLLACGIVAGASIMGVVLAIPFAIKQSSDALKIMPAEYAYLASALSLIVTAALCGWIYRSVMKKSD